MRYDNVLIAFSAVFLLVFGVLYARSAQQQLHFNSSQLESLNSRMDGLIGLVKDTGARDRMYSETIKKIEDRLCTAESEKSALAARVEQLCAQVSELQQQAGFSVTHSLIPEIGPVELGEIAIKK